MKCSLPTPLQPHARATKSPRYRELTGTNQEKRANGQPREPRVHGPFQDPHHRHDQRLLPHVRPGHGPADDHAL